MINNSHMTDQEIVEALATGLMGWAIWEPDGSEGEDRRKDDVERYRKGEIKGFRLRNQLIKNWNPLERWDDTMQVVEQMRSGGEVVELTFDNGTGHYVHLWHMGDNGEPVTCEISLEGNMQKAICLAAISTLSQNNDAR